MLRIVVFDGGYGGEIFADYLEEMLPVVEVIRVIDWRHAAELMGRPRQAREVAEAALRPYLGRVDLVVLANHLLSLTSLKYFRRKYEKQKFLGLNLEQPRGANKHEMLVLTTKAVSRTVKYHSFVRRCTTKARTLTLDTWPSKIDDGELTMSEIASTLETAAVDPRGPRDIVLGCAQFGDIKDELNGYFRGNVRIYDGFETAAREVCRMLKIRGGVGRKRK